MPPPEEVQAFIDQEHAEVTQDSRYLGLYDGRLLSIQLDLLTTYANDPYLPQLPETQIRTLLRQLYNAEYKPWIEAHHQRRQENELLDALNSGEAKLKGSTFEFRGKQYRKKDVKTLLPMVEQEMEQDREWLRLFDREVFMVHLRMAQMAGEGDQDLYHRYHFQILLQDALKAIRQEELKMIGLFQFLSSKEAGLSEGEFNQVVAALREIHKNISDTLAKARHQPLPVLQNMQAGAPLSECLLTEPLVPALATSLPSIDGAWAGNLMQQISQMEERARRLYFKSMGAILARQEAITRAWQEHYGQEVELGHSDTLSVGAANAN